MLGRHLIRTRLNPVYQTNNQSVSRWIDHSIIQTRQTNSVRTISRIDVRWFVSKPPKQHVIQKKATNSQNQSIKQPTNQSIKQPINQPIDTVHQASDLPVNLSTARIWIETSLLRPVFGDRASIWSISLIVLILLSINHLVDCFAGYGPSMEPTFRQSGEVLIMEKVSTHRYRIENANSNSILSLIRSIDRSINQLLSRLISPLNLGDIVVACDPVDPRRGVCKRIVGMPGDTVTLLPDVDTEMIYQPKQSINLPSAQSNDHVADRSSSPLINHSNSQPIDQSVRWQNGIPFYTVPANHVWLQGDRLDASRDSREYGPVPMELLRGRVIACVWPPSRIRTLDRTMEYRGW